MAKGDESEWKTRKKRIDPKLDAAGRKLARGKAHQPFRAVATATGASKALTLVLDPQIATSPLAHRIGTRRRSTSPAFLIQVSE